MAKYSEKKIGNTDYTKDKRPLGFLGDVFAGVFNGIGSFWKKLTGLGTTNSEQSAMDYNAEQAQINRDFQSAEAQKARQWQEDFYTQYQSPQAQVRQYQAAGLNPALMYGRGATPAPSASAASNGPAGDTTAVGLPSVDSASLLSLLFGAAKLPSEIDLLNAQADDFRASATGKDIQNAFSPQILEQNLRKGEMDILNTQAAITTAQYQWSLMSSQEQLNLVKADLTEAQISDVLASASLKEKQAATEVLKQANLEVTNELIAAQIATEKMKPAMIAAQTVLARTQSQSISLDNYQKEVTNEITKLTGVGSVKTMPDIVFQVAGGFSKWAGNAITKSKNWLTRTGKRLLKL